MRLVLVVPRFPRISETFIINKVAGLFDAGWDVHVVCALASWADWDQYPALAARPELRRRIHAQWLHQPRLAAVLLWLPAILSTLVRAPRTLWNYWRTAWGQFGWKAFKRVYLDASLIALSPDILHFEFGSLAVDQTWLRRALDCRLTVSFRGYDLNYIGLEDPDYYARLWAEADGIHILGNDLWQRAIRRGCPADKHHVIIPPAIDTVAFSPERNDAAAVSRRGESIRPERPLRILSVGRLEWKKGYEYALKAVQLLDERGIPFEYRIIGDGDYLEPLTFLRHDLSRHDAGLNDRIHFLGGRPQTDVIKAMAWADVYLQPSVSEGFCNAAMEAQAMRLPVVCSDADGLPENVVDGRTGFVVRRRDAAALSDKLELLADDADLRREMGAAGRRHVEERFQLSDQISAFERFYREIDEGHAH